MKLLACSEDCIFPQPMHSCVSTFTGFTDASPFLMQCLYEQAMPKGVLPADASMMFASVMCQECTAKSGLSTEWGSAGLSLYDHQAKYRASGPAT